MFQTLKLLTTPSVFKEVKTVSGGEYLKGVWTEGTVVFDYETIDGFQEPYVRSESSATLPSGVKSDESLYLYTNVPLKLHNDLPNHQSLADTVYLEDPRANPRAVAYLAYDKEPWQTNKNFRLITQDFNKVILIRKEKM